MGLGEMKEGGEGGCTYGATCGDGTEFEDAFECGIVFSYENWVCGFKGCVERLRWGTTYILFRGKSALRMFLVLLC